jgi:hypothetical protein
MEQSMKNLILGLARVTVNISDAEPYLQDAVGTALLQGDGDDEEHEQHEQSCVGDLSDNGFHSLEIIVVKAFYAPDKEAPAVFLRVD